MDYPAFVAAVCAVGAYDDRTAAEETVRIVLGVLGRRLGEQTARALAARLPDQTRRAVTGQARSAPAGWDACGFVSQIARAFGGTEPEAVGDARAVLTAVADALSGDDLTALLGRLPPDYAALFGRPDVTGGR